MTKQPTVERDAAEISQHPSECPALSSDFLQREVELQRLLHELQVNQISLEMQNEELLRLQHELESSRARYFELYDQMPISYLALNKQGIVHEANWAGQ